MRFLPFLFILLTGLSAFSKPLSLVVTPGYLDFASGKEVVDFIKSSMEDAGFEVFIVEVPRKRGLYSVSIGENDAMIMRSPEDGVDLKNLKNTSFPYAFTAFRVVSLSANKNFDENNLQKYKGVFALNNNPVGRKVREEKLNAIEVASTYKEMFTMILNARVDYVVMPNEFIESFLESQSAIGKKLRVSQKPFVEMPLYFTMNSAKSAELGKIEGVIKKKLKGDLSKWPRIKAALNKKP